MNEGVDFACTFGAAQWTLSDWRMAHSPRWQSVNEWIQEHDHIRNAGAGDEPGETFTSMVCRLPLDGPFLATSTLSFDERMAPLIVLSESLAPLAGDRWEYREHVEVVLFDEGINLWHHTWAEGVPSWTLAANWRFAVEARRRYELGVAWTGAAYRVSLDGVDIGAQRCPVVPITAGITACEGTNRFYDFRLRPLPPGGDDDAG